ncbi:hypothetical protein ACFYYB_33395 [Streptomyces sp. NPDC002886]
MSLIEPGLYVRNGNAEGPLADAALSRVRRAPPRRAPGAHGDLLPAP